MRSDKVFGSDKVFLRALCVGEGEGVVRKGEGGWVGVGAGVQLNVN